MAEEPNDSDVTELPAGCGYQGYEYGARTYPDSICFGGRLYDADACDDKGNLYEPPEDIPCPMCDPKGAVEYWTQRNQNRGGSQRAARNAARSMVKDIRKNRGVVEAREAR
jgi:hypothetical protein